MNKYSFGAITILIGASVIALASVWHDSPIVDEVPHIGAGYSYIAGHTYEFNPEHPPLAKDLAGLGLLTVNIKPEIISNVLNGTWRTHINNQWNFGRNLIYYSGADPITIVHRAKLPLIILFILCGMLIFVWTKKIYTPRAALLAVFLFAFCPTIIAHARLVTTDIAALFSVLFATYFFIRWLEHQSTKKFWFASLSFGIALLTKFSTFLLVPYFILITIVWVWIHHYNFTRPALKIITRGTFVMLVGFVVVVGPIYQLHILNYPADRQKTDSAYLLASHPIPALAHAIVWAADKPVLRPYAEYGLGLAMVFQRAAGGNRTYFLGKLSDHSFKSYFPIVFSLKEPIPLLLLILFAIGLGIRNWFTSKHSLKNKIKDSFAELSMLLWIVIYLIASLNSNLNIGIRHLIPIYGFIFILTAGIIELRIANYGLKNKSDWKSKIRNPQFAIILILLIWYLLEFISVYPYYLTYFNEFARLRPSWASARQGGWTPGGHNYVVDSNLDWGQDLWRLGDFVKANRISKIYVDYFGWADQQFYIGNAFVWVREGQFRTKEQFLTENPKGGWLAVSATFYQESINSNHNYSWLESIKPTTVIGNSIFVFRIIP